MSDSVQIHFDNNLRAFIARMPTPITLNYLTRFADELHGVFLRYKSRASLVIDSGTHQFESIAAIKYLRDCLSSPSILSRLERAAFVAPRQFRPEEVVSDQEAYFNRINDAYDWLEMHNLPSAPQQLEGNVTLHFKEKTIGDRLKGLVPGYHFRIINTAETDVGHINFRVGHTPHVEFTAGHIGFEIKPEHRGNRYALMACNVIAPFVGSVLPQIIITADPTNTPSIRTIENLGTRFLDEAPVPRFDPHYLRGSRSKRRYIWTPK